jgi:hypothetical protein
MNITLQVWRYIIITSNHLRQTFTASTHKARKCLWCRFPTLRHRLQTVKSRWTFTRNSVSYITITQTWDRNKIWWQKRHINALEQSPSWEANISSDGQAIHGILWKRIIHYDSRVKLSVHWGPLKKEVTVSVAIAWVGKITTTYFY